MPFDFFNPAALDHLRAWLATNGLSAIHTARLIGGPTMANSVGALVNDIRDATALSRRHILRLEQLHRLLLLDADPIDEMPVLPLHPADPWVVEICLLADSLAVLLNRLRASRRRAA